MKKKKTNPFLRILGLLFIVFMALFIASSSGYYESKIRDKVVLTDNKIKEFETLVQNGEEIDINDFLKDNEVDYSSFSNLGDKFTSSLENVVAGGAKFIGDILKSLF